MHPSIFTPKEIIEGLVPLQQERKEKQGAITLSGNFSLELLNKHLSHVAEQVPRFHRHPATRRRGQVTQQVKTRRLISGRYC